MSEQDRMSYPQTGDRAVADARTEREQRLAADEASMHQGHAPGHDEQLVHHQGRPTVEQQQQTHGQPAPKTPYTGGDG